MSKQLTKSRVSEKDSSRYQYDILIEFDDGVSLVTASIADHLATAFLGISATQLQAIRARGERIEEYMMKLRDFQGLFWARAATQKRKNTSSSSSTATNSNPARNGNDHTGIVVWLYNVGACRVQG